MLLDREVGRHRGVEHQDRAVRRRLDDERPELGEEVAADQPRRVRGSDVDRVPKPHSPAVLLGQTSVSSHSIASALVTSSGLRSMPPRQATSGRAVGSGAGPLTSQDRCGAGPSSATPLGVDQA